MHSAPSGTELHTMDLDNPAHYLPPTNDERRHWMHNPNGTYKTLLTFQKKRSDKVLDWLYERSWVTKSDDRLVPDLAGHFKVDDVLEECSNLEFAGRITQIVLITAVRDDPKFRFTVSNI